MSTTTNPERNRRILVVDDNRAIHDDFRKIFGRRRETSPAMMQAAAELFGDIALPEDAAPFAMDSAYQGHEAFEMVRRAKQGGRPYAMAFVDVRMPPGWDGIETVQEIWRADRETQIVICTAYSDHSWGDALNQLGRPERIFILKKPFDNIEVLQLATALTEKWWLLRKTNERIAALERAVKCQAEGLIGEVVDTTDHAGARKPLTAMATSLLARLEPAHEQSIELSAGIKALADNLRSLLAGYENLFVAAETGTVEPALLAYLRSMREGAPVGRLVDAIQESSRQLAGELAGVIGDVQTSVRRPVAAEGEALRRKERLAS